MSTWIIHTKGLPSFLDAIKMSLFNGYLYNNTDVHLMLSKNFVRLAVKPIAILAQPIAVLVEEDLSQPTPVEQQVAPKHASTINPKPVPTLTSPRDVPMAIITARQIMSVLVEADMLIVLPVSL